MDTALAVTAPVVLYQLPGEQGLSLSPFCNKVHWALRLKRIPYTTRTVLGTRISPTRRLPLLDCGDERVVDSSEIIRFLEARYPLPPLIPAGRRAAAEATLIEDWADESLCAVMTLGRSHAEARHRTASIVLASTGLPGIVRPFVQRSLKRSGLKRYGHLQPLGAEVCRTLLLRHLDVVETWVEGREWLVGDAVTIADIAVAAMFNVLHIGMPLDALDAVRERTQAYAWYRRFLAAVASP